MDLITFRYIETEPPLPRRSLIKSAHFSLAVSTLICVCVCVLSLLPHLPSSFVPPSSGVYTMESISIISEFYFLKKRRKKKSNTQEKVIVFDIYIFSILYTRKKKKKNKKKTFDFLSKKRERDTKLFWQWLWDNGAELERDASFIQTRSSPLVDQQQTQVIYPINSLSNL